MKRVVSFALLIVASLVAFVVLAAWYLNQYQPSGGSVGGMWGQMMGSGGTNGMTYSMPQGVWAGVVALFALAMVGVVGLGYFLVFPEIRTNAVPRQEQPVASQGGGAEMSWAVLMRTSNAEEKKVLEVLAAHGGSYLQKFVVKEAGLSRLKTHRIVSRFAERGVVTVERSGNTNQVSLAPWVRGDAEKQAPAPVSTGH